MMGFWVVREREHRLEKDVKNDPMDSCLLAVDVQTFKRWHFKYNIV